MRRLLMVCFAVLCVSPCGNAEEKASGSPARGDSIADRLLAVERRLAAIESRPAQPPPIPYVVPQHPPQVTPGGAVAGPWGIAPIAAAPVPHEWRVVLPPPEAIGAVVPRPNSLASALAILYKVVIASEKGGEVVVAIPLGAYRDNGTEELKGELVIDGKDVRLIDARGKAVDKKDALGRLAKRAIVGVVVSNQPIEIDESSPPKFLREVPEDTMVILIPEQKIAALWTSAYSPHKRPN